MTNSGPKPLQWRKADYLDRTVGRLNSRELAAFRSEPLTEWYAVTYGTNAVPRATAFALYRLRLNPPGAVAVADQVAQQQFRVSTVREELHDRYPGAWVKWTELQALERQLQELRMQAAARRQR